VEEQSFSMAWSGVLFVMISLMQQQLKYFVSLLIPTLGFIILLIQAPYLLVINRNLKIQNRKKY
jgi:hypothetical protein